MGTAFDTPPPYMEPRSRGGIVDAVLEFLDQWAKKRTQGLETTGIVCDGMFGETGVRWMKVYQEVNGLEPDGGCGPATRAQMKRDGFDFDEVARTQTELSGFVQPSGLTMYWVNGIEDTADKALAIGRMLRLQRGK